ncbi:hypothetical protein [Phormidium sp. FACHB-1136]|uniref:hypothetical protein n=1 Tax=Phormidium sp. FACHB-1136 TaxID=2692848 RepID=UPI001689150C|nr:hypothetical protein [Phormidium sp. FACHB-1136]MBD2427163.1 hypothetical protein [Phormidium sp. FACHB-1136]
MGSLHFDEGNAFPLTLRHYSSAVSRATNPQTSIPAILSSTIYTKLDAITLDLLLVSGIEKVILEVKLLRGSKFLNSRLMEDYVKQVSNYIASSNIPKAIVYVYSISNTGKIVRNEYPSLGVGGQITIVSTENTENNAA